MVFVGEFSMNVRGKSKKTAVCGIFAAAAITVMFFGTVIEVLDITSAAIASLFVFFVSVAYGYGSGIMLYAVISVLSTLLFTGKLTPLVFLILGYYPIVKNYFQFRIKSQILKWIIKLSIFNFGFALLILFGKTFLFTVGVDGNVPVWQIIVSYLIGDFFIILFDFAMDRVIGKYGGILGRFLN